MTQSMNKFHHTVSMFVRFVFIFWLVAISYIFPVTAQTLPDISDKEFSKIVTTFSEFGGYFPSDNLISNELTYLNVLPSIKKNLVNGGVYPGVGPNQNFVYISAIKPQLAFIVDIRHQNTMQHLVYKVLFELADTRAEFLSLLFSKPLDSSRNLSKNNNIELIVEYFSSVPSDNQMLFATRSKIESRLSNTYGFTLTERDKNALGKVLENFYQYNIDITYTGSKRSWYPTLGQILRMRSEDGIQQNPFNSNDDYKFLRDLNKKHRIIPVTGDFAGSWTLYKISEFLREHFLTVRSFYTSNVEQYLLQNSFKWYDWLANIKQLPITDQSVFIRWTHDGGGYDQKTRLQWIHTFLENNSAGYYQTYYDLKKTALPHYSK